MSRGGQCLGIVRFRHSLVLWGIDRRSRLAYRRSRSMLCFGRRGLWCCLLLRCSRRLGNESELESDATGVWEPTILHGPVL